MKSLKIPKRTRLYQAISRFVAPPPDLTITEWSDENRYLSQESAAEPGKYRSSRAPYQKGMMDAISDPFVQEVVFMMGSQLGKTLTQENVIGYYVDQDPSPIMMVQPTLEMGKAFSKDRLSTMVRDTPVLREKISDSKARDSGNTILHKSFPGGHITLVGSNSPASLASRPIRILLVDELDRFEVTAEGDALDLAKRRTATFPNRKIVIASTPTVKEQSRIEQLYNNSSKGRWNLPCPKCDELQPLEWGRVNFETVSMRCPHCGFESAEMEWKKQQINGRGEWIHEHPVNPIKGFHMNALASPWTSWREMIDAFRVASAEAKKGKPEQLQVFINTLLSETWEEKGSALDHEILFKRRERYDCEVPEDVLVLTAAVDVQDNRLEYEVVGWGLEEECWGIQYAAIMGDPGRAHVWKMLDEVLFKRYKTATGRELQIMTTCIDSQGHHTEAVYKYCQNHEFKRVWAIKGQGGSGSSFIQRPKRKVDGVYLFLLAVDVGKDSLASKLKVENPGPGYCHFPNDPGRGYDEAYFEGLTSEHRKIRYVNGVTKIGWEKKSSGARNEPFDVRNYNLAAFEILRPPLESMKKRLDEEKTEVKAPAAKQTAQPVRKYGVMNKGVQL